MKYVKWGLFGVVFTIAPIFTDFLISTVHTEDAWYVVVSKGELLLASAAIAGAGVGELFGSTKKILSRVSGGICVFLLFVAVGFYSAIASDVRAHLVYNIQRLVSLSVWIFAFTLLASLGCILASEDKP